MERSEHSDAVKPVRLYADGSCRPDIELGAWAFMIPELQLHGSGIERGSAIRRFELMAVVRGLQSMSEASSTQTVQIYSDCGYTVKTIKKAIRRTELREPSVNDDLIAVIDSFSQQIASCQLVEPGNPLHNQCHHAALSHGRLAFFSNPDVFAKVAEEELATYLKRRSALRMKLAGIEACISALQQQSGNDVC